MSSDDQHWVPEGDASRAGRSWDCVFADDFLGESLDGEKWNVGYGWGNATDWTEEIVVPENVVVADGQLELRLTNPNGGAPYHAGAVNTKGNFATEFGYFEARVRVPRGAGFMTMFWVKPEDDSWPPEITIFEILGRNTRSAELSVHYDDGERRDEDMGFYSGPDFAGDFHTFGCEWTPDSVSWFVDGDRVRELTDVAEHVAVGKPFYLMLSVKVGPQEAPVPDEQTPFPSSFDVDWVRVYERD